MRAIKYNSLMAQARRDGRKTQTRRLVDPQPIMRDGNDCIIEFGGQTYSGPPSYLINEILPKYGCPYGTVGDILNIIEVFEDGTLVYDGDDIVTSVRVERIQDISEEDALAEGIIHSTMNDPRIEFRWLWDSIYPGSWERNDFVFVINFQKMEVQDGLETR